jgi:uncharacterized protein (DUF1810 family)
LPAASDLDRFKRAQESETGFAIALAELEEGRKRRHWIWYIFPQLAGLGSSPAAVRYGLRGVAEATGYFRDPVLRERLLAATRAVRTQIDCRPAPRLDAVMGSEIDALKLVSSMTLFREVARRVNARDPQPDYADMAASADAILSVARQQGYAECRFTIDALASSASP